ncbi:MAG TPA: Holliday junction resolvase RuvX [Candidatus Saccharimonadales bacterium]|nr:Holliday junction resolvase RuvX [Candidatus Saccharimonadales bacterium]
MLNSSDAILALDVGAKRIGVATANAVARIAHPLTTLEHTPDIFQRLQALVRQEQAAVLVIGLPRGMQGQETDQTRIVRAFGAEAGKTIGLPIHWQDEAVTSRKAEAELAGRGKPFAKGDIDALAATYILEDFLNDHPEIKA